MYIYLGATILSCLIYMIIDKFYKKRNFIKIFISLIPLLLVSAIRYDVGWDYLKTYTNGFYMIGKGYMPHYFSEIPFDWLVKLIYIISNANPDYLFFVCSFIIFVFISKAIEDQSVNIPLTILLIFFTRYYFLTLNIVRQGIAMSIILYGLKFVKEKNFKKYVITILFASAFHLISLIYIPLYFCMRMDWKKKKNAIALVIIPICIAIGYLVVLKTTKYGGYINSIFNGKDFLIHEIILSATILFFAIIQRNSVTVNKEYYNIYFVLQVFTFIVSILSKILPVADRIVWFLYLQDIFFIPLIIKNMKIKSNKIIAILSIMIVMGINVYMQVVATDSYSIIPYKTIFQK